MTTGVVVKARGYSASIIISVTLSPKCETITDTFTKSLSSKKAL